MYEGRIIIKNLNARYLLACIAILFFIGSGICSLLIYEYFYFKYQAKKLLEMKEEYRTYLVAVRKIVDDYNQIKEQDSNAQDASEKKKESDELKESFVVVNRDQFYLKKSMMDFIDVHGNMRNRINLNDWRDYNEQLLEKTSDKEKRSTNSRSKRVRSQSRRKMAPINGKHDICLAWPIENTNFWLSSFFGPRKQPNGNWGFHYGIDMAALKGTPVKAAQSGMVVEATFGSGFGKTIVIMHNNKYKTRYAHLSSMLVRVGQKVNQGDVIGKVGDTGIVRSTSGRDPSHLHFEVYMFGKRVNPMYYLG